jgi:glycosyltransferase involved in cell wall biosynthesis
MTRPRLFYVLDSLEENEVGDQVATLLGRLPRSRYEPRVVSLGPRGSLGSRIREMRVTVHRLELSGPVGALLAVPRLRRLLAGLKGEILHAFQPWSCAVAQLAAPRRARVYRWVQGFPPQPRSVEERLQAWLERRAVRGGGGRVFASDEGARAAVAERFRLDDVPVVPECVDLGLVRERILALRSREARIRLGMSEGQRAVVCFSDFRDGERMAQLLEGFALARTELPPLRLFVHGHGPQEGGVRARAEDLRLEDSVVFLGTPAHRETALRAAEAVVDAGAWPGWCRGGVEAMALGLPVLRWVASDEDSEATRYPAVTLGPPDRFARDVLDLMSDETRRARVAKRCALEAQAYDVATVADRWAELYAS